MPNSTVHHKLVSFPDYLYQIAAKKTQKIGLSFTDYLRMLVFLDNRQTFDGDIEVADKETQKAVAVGLDDFKHGRYTKVSGNKVDEYLSSL